MHIYYTGNLITDQNANMYYISVMNINSYSDYIIINLSRPLSWLY